MHRVRQLGTGLPDSWLLERIQKLASDTTRCRFLQGCSGRCKSAQKKALTSEGTFVIHHCPLNY